MHLFVGHLWGEYEYIKHNDLNKLSGNQEQDDFIHSFQFGYFFVYFIDEFHVHAGIC